MASGGETPGGKLLSAQPAGLVELGHGMAFQHLRSHIGGHTWAPRVRDGFDA
ncbi:MAG: hypothetical protein VX608_17390 [Chloroflexota bacterium]|nr:hypothetical protein [Chloroflexota bacterium]